MTNVEQRAKELMKAAMDAGKIIEAGFVGLRILAIPANATPAQVQDMRMAFMAGAQHLFSSILCVLDPGTDATEADLRRMDLIHDELEAYRKEMESKAGWHARSN